ncbi:hypothetical protein B0T13DRAFT_435079 [Neurospora crassa]|nr:hypothetical protein B0T13DRAFT_435079 [Neurospora crassa]
MVSFVQPPVLYGFDPEIQEDHPFDNVWSAGFVAKIYTNEQHNEVRRFMTDSMALQELKYANNVFVLFRALRRCGEFWGQPEFWNAMARGYSTKPSYVRELVYMLVDARKTALQRMRRVHNSPTTHVVDEFIAWLDQYGPQLTSQNAGTLTDPLLFSTAAGFFNDMRGTLINCNNIPTFVIGKPPRRTRILEAQRSVSSASPQVPLDSQMQPNQISPTRSRTPPTMPVKTEPRGTGWEFLLEPNRKSEQQPVPPRKRSGSPFAQDDVHPTKRHHSSGRYPEQHSAPQHWNPDNNRSPLRKSDKDEYHGWHQFGERLPPLGPRSEEAFLFWPPTAPRAQFQLERQHGHDQQRSDQQRLRQQQMENQKLRQRQVEEERLEAQKIKERRLELQKLEQEKLRLEREVQEHQELLEKQRLEQQKLDQQKLQEQARPKECRKRAVIPGLRPSPHPSVVSSDEEVARWKEMVSTLEKKLADTEGQLKAAAVIRPLERSISKFQSDVSGLHGDMSTLFDSFQVMVDRMAFIQDDIMCIKENFQSKEQQHDGIAEFSVSVEDVKTSVALVLSEISNLRLQHQQLEKRVVATPLRTAPSRDSEALMTALAAISQKVDALNNEVSDLRKQGQAQRGIAPPLATNTGDLKDIMGVVKMISDNVDQLKNEVMDLKEERARMNDTADSSASISVSVDAELIKALFGEQKALIQSQSQKLDRMAKEISSLQAQVYASGRTQPQPKSLKQAMAAAEKDLQHHLITMQNYRNKMAERGNPPSTVVANMADICQTLEECIQYSKTGQK